MISLHADKLYGEELFRMPFLSRYHFTQDGRVKGRHFKNIKQSPKGGYWLKGDDDKMCSVSPKEIIAYGKHLSHIHEEGIPCGYIKLQSKINTLNTL